MSFILINIFFFLRLDYWFSFYCFVWFLVFFVLRFLIFVEDVYDVFFGVGNYFVVIFFGGLISGLFGGCFFDVVFLW